MGLPVVGPRAKGARGLIYEPLWEVTVNKISERVAQRPGYARNKLVHRMCHLPTSEGKRL